MRIWRATLHKDIEYITDKLSKVANVEIVTNGDVLSSKMLKKLFDANAGRCLISMYDGPEQIEKIQKNYKKFQSSRRFCDLKR